MAKCPEPTTLPDSYASIDNSTKAGMKRAEDIMAETVARNGRDWKNCRDSHSDLVEWIDNLPEPK